MLVCTGIWVAKTNDEDQWIQADLRTTHRIESVTTQGRPGGHNQWVKFYGVVHSNDQAHWILIYRLYIGNVDQNTKKTNRLPSGTDARFVRLLPRQWQGHISMRFDLTGCELTSKFTLNTVDMGTVTPSNGHSHGRPQKFLQKGRGQNH